MIVYRKDKNKTIKLNKAEFDSLKTSHKIKKMVHYDYLLNFIMATLIFGYWGILFVVVTFLLNAPQLKLLVTLSFALIFPFIITKIGDYIIKKYCHIVQEKLNELH